MPDASRMVIEVTGLERRFGLGKTEVRALRGVDLSVRRGEMAAVMGASGSGKSTLMNILGCLDTPTAGSYRLDGDRVDRMDKNQLAAVRNGKIGFVFQGFNLLPRTTALENVELPLLYSRNGAGGNTRDRAREALVRVGLGDRTHHEPNELSGGQQQRVAIARALVTRPSIILADEPTGNLDSVTSVEVLGLFQGLNDQGITVILVTHETNIAKYTRRVIELMDGRIIRDEPVRDRASAAQDLKRHSAPGVASP
jgi:putative ABC transport system ATP-binding protein